MQQRLSFNWTALALRGVVAIVFGIIAIVLPGITLGALILLFAAYALVDGVSHVITGFRQPSGNSPDWLLIATGVVGIAIGVVAAVLPGITALFLLAIIGAWAIVIGALEIVAAYRLRKEISGEWLLTIDGVISIAFGIYILVFPGAGALALVLLIGLYAIISGVTLLGLAFRMRSMADRMGGDRRGSPTPVA